MIYMLYVIYVISVYLSIYFLPPSTRSNFIFLKPFFTGGLISVTGAAKFFREGNEREDMRSFNMAFESSTFTETRPADKEKKYNSLWTDTKTIHVVSSIIYGMN